MARLDIGVSGVIERAEGDIESLLGFTADEMTGLPHTLFHLSLDRPGLSTLPLRRRDGRELLAHAFVQANEAGGWTVYLEDVFGGEAERARLAFHDALFRGLAYAAEYGDPDLLAHLSRVSRYTAWLAREGLGFSEADTARLVVAAYVHDVGKAAIPREILFKPAELTPEERLLVQTHTEKGYAVLREVERYVFKQASWLYDETTWRWALDVVRHHHENWDGSGYPDHKAGEDIPLVARVVKVVDVLDALLHARPYKSAWSQEEVRRDIEAKAGREFDPSLAAWLLQARWPEIADVKEGDGVSWWL